MKKQSTKELLLDITFEEVYINGYTATSVDAILKKAGVPKGSMYHHFKSKKELVLAMVKERLFPKMDEFFIFEVKKNLSVTQSLRNTFSAMAKNKMLITYGCPLYRLMVELSPVDSDFDKLLSSKVVKMQEQLASMLQIGLDSGEFKEIEPKEVAKFILNTTWGVLSLSPSLSSKKDFLEQSKIILDMLR